MAQTQYTTPQPPASTPGARPCIQCGGADRNYRGQCKVCKRASDKAYGKANREKINAVRNAWRAGNERDKEVARAWVENNRDKVRAAAVKFREMHPEKTRAATAAWREEHPEACRVHSANRRARKRTAGGLSTDLAGKLLKLQKGRCACCNELLGDDYHLDHVVPLALGGAHEDANIQLLTALCNLKKAAKHPVDFMQSRGFLL